MAAGSQHDVVVIGAGISGLTAAALLAEAGQRVALIERQPRAGGYLQGFSRQGFTFDTAVHWLSGLGEGGLLRRLLDHLGPGWPACRPLERAWRFRGESYDYLLTGQPDLLRDRLSADFPAEAEGVRRLFADSRHLGEQLGAFSTRLRAAETMGLWTKAGYGLTMLRWYWPLRRFLRSALEPGLARYFKGRELERIFCAEEQLASVMFPLAWGYTHDYFAAPRGGSQAWVAWLLERLRARGAEVRLGQGAERILVEGGRAAGVRLAGGEELRARWVVAACDAESVYARLLPPEVVPARHRRKLSEAELNYSCVMLYCGLSCSPAELGLGEEMVRLTRDDLPRAAHNSGDPDTTALLVLAPSARDPGLAPPGKSTLTIQCPAYLEQQGRWGTGPELTRGADYRACKAAFAEKLLERVERQLVPGLRERLEVLEIATPVTFWRYTGNRGGSIMGYRPTTHNIKAGLARYRTPVKGLLQAGHWAELGGGVLMAVRAAVNASLLVLQPDHPEAYERLRAVMDGEPPPVA
ncbi:MAG TPA: NAD(P)/FAD-dependent oxidoreductase [Myxococcota bacterium]|nr:NAD(P)/FAD-dependent oxidoreductase [Myxococcota bacterium]HRY97015.1 NAD(P)/FAD-dependent oxidoreductase [Myxococcota bacterium]HSA21178.1 NAD(P)/FAD-dependent oxidoreductase [Myxococcota bacterium]